MSQADTFKATLEAQLGESYVLGDEGPATHDCSGLHYEGMRAAGVLWKGKPWPRLTANDYKNMAAPSSGPYRVGDPVFFMGASGHAYHIASVTDVDAGGRDGWTIEARGRRWGVVKYRISDPANGVRIRGGRFYRYPGIDLGELAEDDMTPDEVRAIVREMIETVNDPAAVAKAQQELIAAKVISKGRTPSEAASVGYVDILASRLLRK